MADRRVGRAPYVACFRLIGYAERYWGHIDGETARKGGSELLTLPIDRFFNGIQSWCLDRVKDTNEFLNNLVRPFGETAATAPTAEELRQEGEAFVAFASMFGGSQGGRAKLDAVPATSGEDA